MDRPDDIMNKGQMDISRSPLPPAEFECLMGDIRMMIDSSRHKAALKVNSQMVLLYWQIGNRIQKEILGYDRAAYGKSVVKSLSKRLTKEYGRGYTVGSLFHMIRFAEVFPQRQIVYALRIKFSWTHLRQIIYLKDPLKRRFYIEMCRVEKGSSRTLREKIKGMLFERTAISRRPRALIEQELSALEKEDRITPDLVFQDPYVLDFLNLADTYHERDIESAILHELERFLIELGSGFAFLSRQRRITVGNDDFYLDLLFYHRALRRLVAIDLKLGQFQPKDKGQMEFYLRWLEKHEMKPGERSPVGLILCAGKSSEQVELLRLEESGIRVAQYMTELPPRELLEKKLTDAIKNARALLARREIPQHISE